MLAMSVCLSVYNPSKKWQRVEKVATVEKSGKNSKKWQKVAKMAKSGKQWQKWQNMKSDKTVRD